MIAESSETPPLFSPAEIERRAQVHDVLTRQLGRLSNVTVNAPHSKLPPNVLRFRARKGVKA
jgi:hypothetical protein